MEVPKRLEVKMVLHNLISITVGLTLPGFKNYLEHLNNSKNQITIRASDLEALNSVSSLVPLKLLDFVQQHQVR